MPSAAAAALRVPGFVVVEGDGEVHKQQSNDEIYEPDDNGKLEPPPNELEKEYDAGDVPEQHGRPGRG
ncbi:hypothetical protein TRIUR3_27123 [Triticum urartu]|uniref:Uncharacterized protein n=1 Tax=Triticum urartu TaxID=4572 RepID=M7ZPE4_TRIUA|nr:hypothetical protein TRIUR3_27123 [Triticum urartu]